MTEQGTHEELRSLVRFLYNVNSEGLVFLTYEYAGRCVCAVGQATGPGPADTLSVGLQHVDSLGLTS